MGNENINKEDLCKEVKEIINEFNDINKGINIKANLLDVNIAKNSGTIVD